MKLFRTLSSFNAWFVGVMKRGINGIYSHFRPAAPRGFCQFCGARPAFCGAGQPGFPRGRAGRAYLANSLVWTSTSYKIRWYYNLFWKSLNYKYLSHNKFIQTEFSCKSEVPPHIRIWLRSDTRNTRNPTDQTDLTLPPIWCLQILTDLGADGYEAGAVGFDYGLAILITGDKNLDYGTTKAVFARRFPFTADPDRSSLLRGTVRAAAACEHIISDISDWSASFPPPYNWYLSQYPIFNILKSIFDIQNTISYILYLQYYLRYLSQYPIFNPNTFQNGKSQCNRDFNWRQFRSHGWYRWQEPPPSW